MKRKSIISLLIFCMGLGMFTTSCEDMLKPDSERHSYEVATDTLYSYWGILKSLQNIAERYVILGECRAAREKWQKELDRLDSIVFEDKKSWKPMRLMPVSTAKWNRAGSSAS